ncbi:hypothetical protein ABQZ69_09040, partial [Xanthomonas sp. WHRI 8391]|uniref:hypothetical protein n=1 Tax=unclassified Xanthomonas TaxID=2643310 RepID=UPI0032E8C52F
RRSVFPCSEPPIIADFPASSTPNFLEVFEPVRLWFRVCGSVASGEANYMRKTPIWEEVCEKIFTIFALRAAVSRRS